MGSDMVKADSRSLDASTGLLGRSEGILGAQRALPLEHPTVPVVPVHDQRVQKSEHRRLNGMSLEILELLRRAGRVSNRELSVMFPPGAAWRTRVSDVRIWLQHQPVPETIQCKTLPGGLAWYWIERI